MTRHLLDLMLVVLLLFAAWTTAAASIGAVVHPVYPPGISAADAKAIEPRLARYLAMSDAELRALVPKQTGLSYCGCPNCQGGTAENNMVWSPEDPDHVHCKSCGKVYPSPDYPMTHEIHVKSPSGEDHVYRYYEDAKGQQYFFEARIWYDRIHYYDEIALQLAKVYAATHDERYAQATAALVDQYARVVPGYVPSTSTPTSPSSSSAQT